MPPEIRVVFRLGRVFGFMPFTLDDDSDGDDDDVVRFSWSSPQVAYFLVVLAFCLASFAFALYGFLAAYLVDGLADAMLLTPWVASLAATVLVLLATLIKRNEVMNYINEVSKIHRSNMADPRYSVTKTMWRVHLLWAMQALVVPQVSVAIMGVRQPVTLRAFHTHLFCASDDDCPVEYMVPSAVLQAAVIAYIFFSILLLDILPVANVKAIANWMRIAADHMLEHCDGDGGDCTHGCSIAVDVVGSSSTKYKANVSFRHGLDDRVAAIRRVMSDHLEIQAVLQKFNPAFAPFILVGLGQIFSMCIVLFFGLLLSMQAKKTFYVGAFFGNAAQYLVRGTIILSSYGSVREQAERLKSALLLRTGLVGGGGRLGGVDSSILQEVQLFMEALDGVYVQGGSYLYCTHGFLFTFYGILATYIAILYQSF